jgi:hypothetical protein
MPWTASVDPKVEKWTTAADDTKLAKVCREIVSSGPDHAEGLRRTKPGIYDVHSARGGDFRIVGKATGTDLVFTAVYSHGRGGGKQLVAGKAVAGY